MFCLSFCDTIVIMAEAEAIAAFFERYSKHNSRVELLVNSYLDEDLSILTLERATELKARFDAKRSIYTDLHDEVFDYPMT